MADKKPTYWEQEEKTRDKMDWRNAGFSAAEKKAMAKKSAAKKMAEMKKKTFKPTMKNGKYVIPPSPTK